ncbi:RluA family pseudouridine synthase [Deferribacter thermophilus]|uniref:RluA family pseudouridine synthase n=1 Tax=Deferribacter thermophilus TaxID=53573 RepID=UPI003C23357A
MTLTQSSDFEIVYNDKDIIVLNKSHSIHTIPDRYNKELPSLKNILQNAFKEIYVVHRLDFGTGGLIVFAKNRYSHKSLSTQFSTNQIDKRYLCITDGVIKYPFTSLLPISKRNYHGKYKINFKSGRKSITTFIPINYNNKYSLIEAIPKTGRSHQIRVHLKAYKAPLYQDFLYNKKIEDKRLTLFAYYLSFTHPTKNKKMEFKIKLSDFMNDKLIETGLIK